MAGLRSIAGVAALLALLGTAAQARTIVVPFDFSRHQIGLSVSVRGTPLYMFLDTGNSPSVIDTARAKALGLKIDYAHGGEASGQGDSVHLIVYPTAIDGLVLGGRAFPPIEALVADHKAISSAYGRTVDGTLGHSFFAGRVVLIDYAAATVAISDDGEAEMAPKVAACRSVWRAPLKSFAGDTIPVVDLKIGDARLPVSVDTGSDGIIELFRGALNLPAVKAALVEAGSTNETGARGGYVAKVYKLNAPIALGPFVLPAGQSVTLADIEGSADTRLANLGNRLLAGMGLKLLLDYRDNRIAFYGDCAR